MELFFFFLIIFSKIVDVLQSGTFFFLTKQTSNLQVIHFYCPLEQNRNLQAMENVKTNILTVLLKKSWYFGEKRFRKKPHF